MILAVVIPLEPLIRRHRQKVVHYPNEALPQGEPLASHGRIMRSARRPVHRARRRAREPHQAAGSSSATG